MLSVQGLFRGALAASLILILTVAWNVPPVLFVWVVGGVAVSWAASAGLPRLPRAAFLASLLVLCVGLRGAWIASVPNEQTSDFAIYHELAESLESAHAYAITGPVGVEDLTLYVKGPERPLPYVTALRAPGASFLYALAYAVSVPEPIVGKLLNILLDAGSCLLLYALLARIGHEVEGRLAAMLWALYPPAIVSCSLICTEVPTVFFLLLSALALPGLVPTAKRAFLHGLACGAMALIRPTLFQVAIASLAALSLQARRRLPLLGLALVLGLSIPVLPWTIRNWRVFDAFVPVPTNVGIFMGIHTQITVPERIRRTPEWRSRIRAWDALTTEVERSQEGSRLGLANLALAFREGPTHWVESLQRGLRFGYAYDHFMLEYASAVKNALGRPDPRLSPPARRILTRIFAVFYLTLVGLAALGVAAGRAPKFWTSGPSVFLALYFLAMFGSALVIPGIPRYHYPQAAIFVLWAAFGIGPVRRASAAAFRSLRR